MHAQQHCETTACETESSNQHCDFSEKLLCLADEAWKELLKEKIKQQIEANSGEKLEKLAKAIAETNQQKWQLRISGKKLHHEFKDKLKSVFS